MIPLLNDSSQYEEGRIPEFSTETRMDREIVSQNKIPINI
jgi:hypothetical protein